MARRSAGAPGDRSDLRVGSWRVQPTLNQIDDGRTVRHLEPQVMDLLVFLASAGRRVVSKDEIINGVWEGRFIAEATLTRSVADLRRALGDTRSRRRYIETIPKRGYRLVASMSGVASHEPAAAAPPVESSAAAVSPPSLVVLPFSNLGSPDDRYFCEGLTEEIINVLTRIPGLRVISRTSAFAAHASGGDVAEIGRRLGVTHAIEGSSRRSEGRVRVTAQLIRVSDHGHVWTSATTVSSPTYLSSRTRLLPPSLDVSS
jgi:TolB-like protein